MRIRGADRGLGGLAQSRDRSRTQRPHLPAWAMLALACTLAIAGFLVGMGPGLDRLGRAKDAATASLSGGNPNPGAPYAKRFFQRGVNFTSEGRRSGYQSEDAHQMLSELREREVDAIALVPYGMVRSEEPALRFGGWERDESIATLTETAHKLGMRVMLKPLIWIRGSYPGAFDLPDEAARNAWLLEYRNFALHYAGLAARTHVDLFCIGTEFAKLTPHERFWRDLIAEVRQHYPGPLTYAANWGEEFETLRFWDALDYMGLNNYYPLPDNLDFTAQLERVSAVQSRTGKPLLLTEVGISSYEGAHRKPWAEREGAVDLEVQAAVYDALLAAYWEKPWFFGAYWWKLGTNGFGGPEDRTHTPWGKPAMDVVTRWYRKPVTRPSE